MNDFAGTATLVRLALRRDRVLLPVWIIVFVSMAAGSAKASIDLYPDVASRVSAANTSNSSAGAGLPLRPDLRPAPRSVSCRCSS